MKPSVVLPLFVATLILLSVASISEARRRHRGHLPIDRVDEDDELGQRRRKSSECRFGGKRYELEQTWNPDLGTPFGVMYCVHCECVPIHKKRRIVGRVRCRNIRNECPKPNCPDPVLLPQRCCKVCPGQTDNPDLEIDVDLAREEEEKNGRHYAALLTRRTSENDLTSFPTPGRVYAGTGRLSIRKKVLSYSFVTTPEFGAPKLLTFMDPERNIIEEFPLTPTEFQTESGKLCGNWDLMPRKYRRSLRRDELFTQLTNSRGDIIEGKVAKHYGLSSELFSALLVSRLGFPGAATAIVTTNADTGSVHVMLLLDDIFDGKNLKDVLLQVQFKIIDAGETRIIQEDLKVPKVFEGKASIDFTTSFGEKEFEALGKGEMWIRVVAPDAPHREVDSKLVPRFSCDIFDCVLSPVTNTEDAYEDFIATNTNRHLNHNGIAWLIMTANGELKFSIRTNNLEKPPKTIYINNGKKSRRLRRRSTDDLSESYRDGWTNGTITMGTVDLEDLYKADLFLNVIGDTGDTILSGRIIPQEADLSHRILEPMLLSNNDTSVAGIGWAVIDWTCSLNYRVRIAGVDSKSLSRISLKDYPMHSLKAHSTMPGRTVDIETFKGVSTEGKHSQIHKLTLARLDAGDASLVISQGGSNPFRIEGRIIHVQSPMDCLPKYARNELELMPGYLSDIGEVRPEHEQELANRCLYEGMIYEEGKQWTATHKACHVCACHRGKVKCEEMVCPPANCSDPTMLEGHCCPTCTANIDRRNDGKGCQFGEKFHPAGSRWHPYLPPFGFTRCATCTCQPDTLSVECHKKQCPALDCPEERRELPDPLSCCKVCRELTQDEKDELRKSSYASNPEFPHDQRISNRNPDKEILASGGCSFAGIIYENGDVWHPRIEPAGLNKCIYCSCKDGNSNCSHKECPHLTCRYKVKDDGACCKRCAKTAKEVYQAKRRILRRLRRRNRLRNKN